MKLWRKLGGGDLEPARERRRRTPRRAVDHQPRRGGRHPHPSPGAAQRGLAPSPSPTTSSRRHVKRVCRQTAFPSPRSPNRGSPKTTSIRYRCCSPTQPLSAVRLPPGLRPRKPGKKSPWDSRPEVGARQSVANINEEDIIDPSSALLGASAARSEADMAIPHPYNTGEQPLSPGQKVR